MISVMAKSGGRRLYDHRQHDAHGQKYQHGQITHRRISLQECKHLRIALQVRNVLTYQVKSHKEESKAYKEFAYRLVAALFGKSNGIDRPIIGRTKAEIFTLNKQGYHPGGKCGAHVGAHNDSH